MIICNASGHFHAAIIEKGRIVDHLTALCNGQGAVIGERLAAGDGQRGILRYGQALALTNLQILLQGHISVHGAVLAVKDDAAVLF